MNYKQIGEILNDVYGSIIGEGELIKEDLSNIVEVGKVITSNSTFDDNFDNLVKKLVDKVGKTIEHTDTLEARHLPIYRDSWEYGSILEKIRVEAPETEEERYIGEKRSGETSTPSGKQVNTNKGTTYDTYRDWETDRKSTRLNSSHSAKSRMPSSA